MTELRAPARTPRLQRPGEDRPQEAKAADIRRRLVTFAGSRRAQTIAALLLYAAFAIQYTWPLAIDLESRVFGGHGDLTGGIAVMRETVESGHNPFAPGTLHDWSAPEGRPILWTQNLASFASTGVLYGLTWLFGAVAAFNLFVLGAFAGSGFAMFLLARRLTGHFGVSLVIGWAFAFYPFAAIKAGGHPHFAHGWVLVLMLWRMLELYERPSLRNGALAGLGTVVALAWSPYFLLIAGIAYAALFAVGVIAPLVRREEIGRHLRAQLASAGIVLVFAALLVGVASLSSLGTGTRDNSLDAVYIYSARPYEYVVPAALGTVWDDLTQSWLKRHIHGSNFAESSLYLGISMLLLALVGLVAALRRRLGRAATLTVVAACAMGFVALVWSAPPKVTLFGHVYPFPSLLTFDISSAWRVYARFVIVVMLAVSVLAAIGLHRLVRGRSLRAQALILVPVAALIVLDLSTPPVGTTKLGVPRVYEKLRTLPKGLVAEYPIEPNGRGDYSAEFYQDLHGFPIINGFEEGSWNEARGLKIDKLSDPTTPGRLATLGVRYVVVSYPAIEGEVQRPGRPAPGLIRLFRDQFGALYGVRARPQPLVSLARGFAIPEPLPKDTQQWLAADRGEVEILARCSPCVGTLELRGFSLGQPRTLRLSTRDGRTLGVRRVGTRPATVSFPLRLPGSTRLVITTTPGPEPVAKVLGTPDPRSFSVSFPEARFRLRSPAPPAGS